MCYTRRKIQGGVGALREFDDTNFLKPNGQSRNLNVYGHIPETDLVKLIFRSVARYVSVKFTRYIRALE